MHIGVRKDNLMAEAEKCENSDLQVNDYKGKTEKFVNPAFF